MSIQSFVHDDDFFMIWSLLEWAISVPIDVFIDENFQDGFIAEDTLAQLLGQGICVGS